MNTEYITIAFEEDELETVYWALADMKSVQTGRTTEVHIQIIMDRIRPYVETV